TRCSGTTWSRDSPIRRATRSSGLGLFEPIEPERPPIWPRVDQHDVMGPAHLSMNTLPQADPKLARQLVLDELFDLSLYRSLRTVARGELGSILDRLIPIEARHFAFWKDFFKIDVDALDAGRRLKLWLLVLLCRLLGAPAIHLVLEAIEIYGVRKYL